MDINGTHFHLLTGERDWEAYGGTRLSRQHLWWDREGTSLSLTPRILQFPQQQGQSPLTPQDRRGAAGDAYGNVFWINEDGQEIHFLPAGTQSAGTYWTVKDSISPDDRTAEDHCFRPVREDEPLEFLGLRGLTVTEHQFLVVGTLQPAGILVFDLHAGGPPTWKRWPVEQSLPFHRFAPFDMAPAPEGGVWILDRVPENSVARLWRLDRFFRIITSREIMAAEGALPDHDFKAVERLASEDQTCAMPLKLTFEDSFEVPVMNAISVVGLPDGTVLILDSPPDRTYSMIHRFRYHECLDTKELMGEILAGMLDDGSLKAHDFAFIPDEVTEAGRVRGELALVADSGNQAFIFQLAGTENEFRLDLRPRYFPLRRFSGKGLIVSGGAIYYDFDQCWLPLASQPRQRFEAQGRIKNIVLDGKVPDCVWHRLLIDGCIPEGTAIAIETRNANERHSLLASPWSHEPLPYLRKDGSEIPLHTPFTHRELQHDRIGTWELLFQNAKGRFMELRMTLRGNGQMTPRIRALRVYYPRFSYVEKYLPAVYREEPDSGSLLERFLANTEAFYSTIEGRIAKVEALLDIRTAPPEFLDWLAGWVGTIFDPDWDDYRRRLFLSHAILLYRWRGTQIGLRAAIRIAIDPCPDESLFDELKNQSEYRFGALGGNSIRIVENFLTRKFPGVVLGDASELQGPDLMSANDIFQSVDNGETTDQRFRDFMRRTYSGPTEKAALDRINSAWGEDFDNFDQIHFSEERPSHIIQSRDWVRFLRYEIVVGQPWEPSLGAYALHIRFREFLYQYYSNAYGEAEALNALNARWGKAFTSFEEVLFSPILPADATVAEDWMHFTQNVLGFSYAVITTQDEAMYREFLARRYRRPETLSRAYGLIGAQAILSFDDVRLPEENALPMGGKPLFDWIQFVSLTVPIKRNAHRFTVLIPTEPGEDLGLRGRRLSKVEHIVRNEKPAHTDFDIKFFWALFQIGGARLGLDTILGESSRYVAMVLGVNYLGQSFLAGPHPWDVTDRTVIGRDPLKEE